MTYQQTSSYDAREEPHKVAKMVFRSVLCFPIGKVQQNISYNADDGEPHQRMSDASCALPVAHSGSVYFFLLHPAPWLGDGPDQMRACPSAEKAKDILSPFLQPLKYSEF